MWMSWGMEGNTSCTRHRERAAGERTIRVEASALQPEVDYKMTP